MARPRPALVVPVYHLCHCGSNQIVATTPGQAATETDPATPRQDWCMAHWPWNPAARLQATAVYP